METRRNRFAKIIVTDSSEMDVKVKNKYQNPKCIQSMGRKKR